MSYSWEVMKFGGTSVSCKDAFIKCVQIIEQCKSQNVAVVVSAMGKHPVYATKTTDLLLNLLPDAIQGKPVRPMLDLILNRHIETMDEILPKSEVKRLGDSFVKDMCGLEDILRAVTLIKGYDDRIEDLVAGHGELWSAQILCSLLNARGHSYTYVDARNVLKVVRDPRDPEILWDISSSLLTEFLQKSNAKNLVITGFIASTMDGTFATLKRDGSDYSASIFGRLLHSKSIVIWTDVSGVLSADPRRVPEAKIIPEVSYYEAMELAYFGAKVIHPKTMTPAVMDGIPIYIRNTFQPEDPGTRIYVPKVYTSASVPSDAVIGFSTVDDMALVNIEGPALVGVKGSAARIFTALSLHDISIVLIAQSSSEQSISICIRERDVSKAKQSIQEAFASELNRGTLRPISIKAPVSIIAAVGDAMAHTPGVSGRFFSALGHAGVNIMAISQGSSERNISAVVGKSASARALNAVHSAFFLSDQAMSVGLLMKTKDEVKVGHVEGEELLKQIHKQLSVLNKRFKVDLRVRGIATSKTMLLDDHGINLETWQQDMDIDGQPFDMEKFTNHIRAEWVPHWVLVDLMKDASYVQHYPEWIRSHMHVVSSNKAALAAPIDTFYDTIAATRKSFTTFKFESCVCAGLALTNVIRDVLDTGDSVTQVKGCFSGTLSLIFNSMQLNPDLKFSDAVHSAIEADCAEPDPREDLSGKDVARKVVAMARFMGLSLELSSVDVTPLISATSDSWKQAILDKNEYIGNMFKTARENKQTLQYTATISVTGPATCTAKVGLEFHPKESILGNLTASDACAIIHTERFKTQPLIVQGPAARVSVTAKSVFADLLRLSRELGARDGGLSVLPESPFTSKGPTGGDDKVSPDPFVL